MAESETLRGGFAPRLALAALGLAAGFLAAEVAVRATGYFPFYMWEYHDTIVELDPRLLYRFQGASRDDLNSSGYRDYEFPRAKGDRYRILVLGDSFVFGDNVEPEETIPKVLEDELGDRFEVFNMGVIGYGPDQSYAQLLEDGLDYAPDAVILTIYPANDFGDLLRNELVAETGDQRVEWLASNPSTRAIPRLRLLALLRNGGVEKTPVLFMHTGGTPALFGYQSVLSEGKGAQ